MEWLIVVAFAVAVVAFTWRAAGSRSRTDSASRADRARLGPREGS